MKPITNRIKKDQVHKQNIPELRFPKFHEKWVEISFSDYINIISGGTPSTKNESYWNGTIPWIAIDDFNNDEKFVSQTERTITESGLKNSSTHILKKNDLILSARGTVGKISMIPFEMAFNQSCYGLRANNNINPHFLYYLFHKLQKTLKRKSYGSTFNTISSKDLKNIKIKIPPLNEQDQISKFFSCIDRKIELMEKKYQIYKKMKNSFLYNMFCNKQNIPELRFPEFDGEWDEYKLKDLSKIQRGASPRPINDKKWYDNENKNVGWVRIGDVTKGSRFLYETEDYFSEEGIRKSRFLPKGSLIMSICATIGKPIITGIDTCIHDGFVGFSNLNNVDKEFLYYILKNLEKRFISLSQTGSQANLNTDLINNAKVHIPSMEEQKKIVSLISTIDQKIDSMEKKIDFNLEFKKSLLNKMFC